MEKRNELIIATILRDFERFYNDTSKVFIKRNESLLSKYIDINVLNKIIDNNSNYNDIYEIIERARYLSLCETDKSTRENHVNKRLTSVFSRLNIGSKTSNEKVKYSNEVLDVTKAFPNNKSDVGDYISLINSFNNEIDKLSQNPPKEFKDFLVVFDTILKKYLWCIPASDFEGEDISLYDHIRITCAIAISIYECNKENGDALENFKLVVGDFSGIQNYIFSVANTSSKGVAKRLRARSFYVDTTVGVFSHHIIDKFNLIRANILMLTGGKFYLLLPNTKESDDILKSIEKSVADELYRKFNGEISINLAWINIGGEGLEDYSKSITELSRELSKKKSKNFSNVLISDEKWQSDRFVIYNDLSNKSLCKSCRTALTIKGRENCENCDEHEQIGTRLTKSKYIIYSKNNGDFKIFGDYYISLGNEINKENIYLVEKLNGNQIETYNKPLTIKYMANNIPTTEEGQVLTFGDLAEKSKGSKRLAVLKADVDSLGYLFADGLRTETRHYGTISRVNTMSRMLELFFSGYVNYIIKEKYRDVYSVFSGGDDLFLIGPWDIMPRLAIELNAKFKEFVGNNPCITLSAAICVFYPKIHIANMAELSEEQLKDVKNKSVDYLYKNKKGRNGVFFLDEIFSWDDLEEQLNTGNKIKDAIKTGKLDSGILKSLSTYSVMYKKYVLKNDIMGFKFHPLISYHRKRHMKRVKKANIGWFLNYYICLGESAIKLNEVDRELYFAAESIKYALNITREERKNGI